MDIVWLDIVWFLLIGAVAGWLAGQLVKGRGFGILGNIVVGVIGGVIGGFLARQFGVSVGGGLIGPLVIAFVGALLLLLIVGLIRKV